MSGSQSRSSSGSSSDAVDMAVSQSSSGSSMRPAPCSPHPPTQRINPKATQDRCRNGRSLSVVIARLLEKSRNAEEDGQNNIRVNQATGLAAISSSPSSGSHKHVEAEVPLEQHVSLQLSSQNCYATNLVNPCPNGALDSGVQEAPLGPSKRRRMESSTLSGSGMTSGVRDESGLKLPLEFGWKRETRLRREAGRVQGEVTYFAPCGMKLRRYPTIMKYLVRNGITEITRDHFSFSPKIKVGTFYEASDGPEGPQWLLLAEQEIDTIIILMSGRRKRPQPSGDGAGGQQWKYRRINVGENDFQDVNNAQPSLEVQEMVRLVAEINLIKKEEKQAVAQAAKEARKEEALRAAEYIRQMKEQLRIEELNRKIECLQQERMEKQARAKEILEGLERRRQEMMRNKEEETHKKAEELERRRQEMMLKKEEETRKKAEELERRRQEKMRNKEEETRKKAEELERRRQEKMLKKEEETRKKAEEKEQVKQVKAEEKRLNNERKLQLRQLALQKAKALKKPIEDMCLADLKCLPELSRIPGLLLQGSTLSDCLMVMQFLHSFGKVLGFDNLNDLNLSVLQEGLLNPGGSMGKVQDLLVSMVSSAIQDPGIPAGHRSKTLLGENLKNVAITRDNVSEILQIYMQAHCDQTESTALALSLRTRAFQAHSASEKVCILSFLVNELCGSKAVISEIDKKMDHMTNLRKDMRAVEGKLRKLRSIHSKRTKKSDSSVDGDDNLNLDDDSEVQADEEEGEDYEGRTWARAEICEEEDDSLNSASLEELVKQIEKLCMQQSQIKQNLLHSSQSQRSIMMGQDRYKRRYWLFPECGGILVEGIESPEGIEEMKEIQEAHLEESEMEWEYRIVPGPDRDTATPESQQDKGSLKIFLKRVAKKARSSNTRPDKRRNSSSAETCSTASYPSHPSSQTEALHDKPPCALFPAVEAATTQNYPTPQPIPKEMLHGWWQVADLQELHNLVGALHGCGMREQGLQKNLQEHMEYLTLLLEDGMLRKQRGGKRGRTDPGSPGSAAKKAKH